MDCDVINEEPEQYLHSIGTVFAEFGALTQDSGNVSYGVQIGAERYFVKMAGRKPLHSFQAPFDSGSIYIHILVLLRHLRILRQWAGVCDMSPDYSPVMGETGVAGFYITTGWGLGGSRPSPPAASRWPN